MSRTLITASAIITLLIAVGLLLFFMQQHTPNPEPTATPPVATTTPDTPAKASATSSVSTIGLSVEGRAIEAYTFGTGHTDLLFIGGIHGGYEWNSIILAYEMIDSFQKEEIALPDNITVHIIPNLNPDGLFLATGKEGVVRQGEITSTDMHAAGIGRFNANGVDLNRNFDCKWAPESSWRGQAVSAGTEPFSEPEARALRTYVTLTEPEAAIFWHSQANNVYASECHNGVLPETLALMSTYAQAGGYGEVPVFDAYPITGDAEGWLATLNIPAITVELETRTSMEWSRNLAGVEAVLSRYAEREVR